MSKDPRQGYQKLLINDENTFFSFNSPKSNVFKNNHKWSNPVPSNPLLFTSFNPDQLSY